MIFSALYRAVPFNVGEVWLETREGELVCADVSGAVGVCGIQITNRLPSAFGVLVNHREKIKKASIPHLKNGIGYNELCTTLQYELVQRFVVT